MTRRTAILAWIMSGGDQADEDDLAKTFGEDSVEDVRSLIELGLIRRMKREGKTIFYEVNEEWVKLRGKSTGSRRSAGSGLRGPKYL